MTCILGQPSPSSITVRMIEARVSAGFPSPAEDYAETYLSLDELVNVRAPSVFLVRVSGNSLRDIGVYDQDVIVVDRALEAAAGEVVIAEVNGEFTAKILSYDRDNRPLLLAANPDYPPIQFQDGEELSIWGVATDCLHSLRRKK